jgi:hypothetical protein
VSVANAELIPRAHLRLARLIVEDGWSISPAAKMFRVSWPTAKRWADRFAQHGKAGMQDRSSRPHYCPCATAQNPRLATPTDSSSFSSWPPAIAATTQHASHWLPLSNRSSSMKPFLLRRETTGHRPSFVIDLPDDHRPCALTP